MSIVCLSDMNKNDFIDKIKNDINEMFVTKEEIT